jgi:hypothetical protein
LGSPFRIDAHLGELEGLHTAKAVILEKGPHAAHCHQRNVVRVLERISHDLLTGFAAVSLAQSEGHAASPHKVSHHGLAHP